MVTTIEQPVAVSERPDLQPETIATPQEQPIRPLPHQPLPEAPKKLLTRYEDLLIPALVLFLIGNALAFALPNLAFARLEVGLPICMVFLGIAIYGITKPESRWAAKLNLWLIVLIAGSIHYQYRHFVPTESDIATFAPLDRAEVIGLVRTQTAKNRVVMQVSQLNGRKVTGVIQATLPQDNTNQPIEAGTRILIDGSLQLPFHSSVPGAFDQAAYLSSQHITAVLRKPNRMIAFESSQEPRFVLQRMTDQLKQRVAETFAASLPSPQSEILGGIVLGDKAIPVNRETKQAFIQTGLIHVLAASGLNVGIIAGVILWVLARLKTPYKKRIAIAMVAVAFYSLLTGLPPSIQRAATMLEIALFLKLLNRELSPVFLLCLTSALLVGWNPENIANIGFQFSVLTTFGLLTMVEPLQDALGYYITRWLAGIILVPAIAQLWVWPLSVAYFNQFPIHTVPLNILALVLVGPLTLIGFVAGLLSLIHPSIGGWVSVIALPFLNGLLGIVQWGSSWTWAQWTLPSPQPWQVLALYGCLFTLTTLLHQFKNWPLRLKMLLGLAPLMIILGGTCLQSALTKTNSQISLLPLSHQHEAVLIRPAGANTHMLLVPDALSYFEARALGDYLRHTQLKRLDAVVLIPSTAGNANSSLKTAFQKAKIDFLIAQNTRELPTGVTGKHYRSFPKRGGTLQAGPLKLQGVLTQLKVLQDQTCLMTLQQTMTDLSRSQGCGVQLVQGDSDVRLFSGQAPLKADHFYQLSHQGNTLSVY